MAKIFFDGTDLIIQMQGIRKFGSMKSELRIPVTNIVSIEERDKSWKDMPRFGQKRIGADAYGFYFGGTFKQRGKRVFYDLKKGESALEIHLRNSEFEVLIVGTEQAGDVAAQIGKML